MTGETSRSWAEAAASMILIALAALIALLAGLAILFLLPATLVIVAFDFAELWAPAGAVRWIALLWFPAAFAAAVYMVMSGFEATEEPSLGRIGRMFLLAVAVFFSFPPFWLPG